MKRNTIPSFYGKSQYNRRGKEMCSVNILHQLWVKGGQGFLEEVPLLKKTIGTFGQIKEASGFSIGGTWGRRRSRGGRNKNWRIQTLFFPLVKLCCASKWKWRPIGLHSHFLRCFLFVILQCSSLSWNTTDEGAIALKALVHVQNKCQIQLCSVWWIREENSREMCLLIKISTALNPLFSHLLNIPKKSLT